MTTKTTRFALRRYSGKAQVHAHDHHQLVLPLPGILKGAVMEMEVEGQESAVTERQGAVISAGQRHSFAVAGDEPFLIVDLPAIGTAGGDEPFWREVRARPFLELDAAFMGFCEILAGQVGAVGFHGLRAEVAGGFVLDALARNLGLERAEALSPVLRRARAFMAAHLCEPLTLEAVARAAGISESRLQALFKEQLGLSPKRYLARERLGRAALLLEESRLSIAEIAFRVGYGDQSAFTRAFQRKWGQPPADYRRARQTKE